MAEEYKFETRCIHGNGGLVEGHPYGAVSVPIFQTATFAHPGICLLYTSDAADE